MLLIEGMPILAFEARTILCNHTCITTDKYNNLWRAIARSRVDSDGHNYRIGERIKMKTEFYEYASNTLVVHEQNDAFTFIIILHGHIYCITTDVEDANIKQFFATHTFCVIDSYGKELLLPTYEQFLIFINTAKHLRENFTISLDKYHKYMNGIYEFRRLRENELNCFVSEDYNKLLAMSDDFAKEMIDMLNAYQDDSERKIVKQFIKNPTSEEKNCVIFGLYIAVLRAYKLDSNYESVSLDERLHNAFMKEFNLFLAENENILDLYSIYFALKKCEYEEIDKLLKDEALDGKEWSREYSEISIL